MACVNQENATIEEVLKAQRCAPTQEGFRRFQAIEFLYAGYEVDEVVELSRRSARTLRRWIAAFNSSGIDGLAIKPRSGRPRKIRKTQFAEELVPLVLDPTCVGESHWSGVIAFVKSLVAKRLKNWMLYPP